MITKAEALAEIAKAAKEIMPEEVDNLDITIHSSVFEVPSVDGEWAHYERGQNRSIIIRINGGALGEEIKFFIEKTGGAFTFRPV